MDDAFRRRYLRFLLADLPPLAGLPLPRWHPSVILDPRRAVLRAALRRARRQPGMGLEFGVYRGRSFRLSARAQP